LHWIRRNVSMEVHLLAAASLVMAVAWTGYAMFYAPFMAHAFDSRSALDNAWVRAAASNAKLIHATIFLVARAGLAHRAPHRLSSFFRGYQIATLLVSLAWLAVLDSYGYFWTFDIAEARVAGRIAAATLFGDSYSTLWPTGTALWLLVALPYTI